MDLEAKIEKLNAGLASSAESDPSVSAIQKRRGRKSKTAADPRPKPTPVTPDTEPNPKTVAGLKKVFRPTGNALTRAFDVTPLEDEEVDTLAEGWALLVDEYMDRFGDHAPWIMAAGSTLMVAGPRVVEYYERREGQENKPETAAPEPTVSDSF